MFNNSAWQRCIVKSPAVVPITMVLLGFLTLQLACSKPPAIVNLNHSEGVGKIPSKKTVGSKIPGDSANETPEATEEGSESGGTVPEKGGAPSDPVPGEPAPVNSPKPSPTPAPVPGAAPSSPPKDPGADQPQVPVSRACVDQSEKCHPHAFIMADEPLRKILFVNLDDPSKDWDLNIPGGARDLQIIGSGKVLVGTLEGPGGYHEVDIASGKILKSVLGFGAVGSVQRLKNGNTLVMGEGLDGSQGTVVLEVDGDRKIKNKYVFKDLKGGRMIRRTRAGTFLVGTTQAGSDGKDAMVEITPDGKELMRLQNNDWPAHMALRLPNGDTIVASGHGKTLMIFDNKSTLKKTIGGPGAGEAAAVNPNYSGQFSILPNGNYLMTNWQGHESNHGKDGRQVIEYNAEGKLVWWWNQDAKRISSIHSVLVLDNLDLNQAYDDTNGMLEPLK